MGSFFFLLVFALLHVIITIVTSSGQKYYCQAPVTEHKLYPSGGNLAIVRDAELGSGRATTVETVDQLFHAANVVRQGLGAVARAGAGRLGLVIGSPLSMMIVRITMTTSRRRRLGPLVNGLEG